MRSYDEPLRQSYNLGLHDFGAGGDSTAIPIPAGFKYGRVRDISLLATELFTNVTTAAFVRVGNVADPDHYAELDAGVLADATGLSATNQAAALKDPDGLGKGVFKIADAQTQVEVDLVACTGGTPAGIAYTTVHMEWF